MRMRTMTQGSLSVNDVTAAPLAQQPRPLLQTNSALVQLSVSDDPDRTADPRNQQQPQNREPSQVSGRSEAAAFREKFCLVRGSGSVRTETASLLRSVLYSHVCSGPEVPAHGV